MSKTNLDLDQLLTVREFADLAYGNSGPTAVRRVNRLISTGKLPATRKQGLGPKSANLISRKDADKFLAAKEKSAPAPLRS